MTAAESRARAVLDRLPSGTVIGAEIGVYDGRMSCELLRRDDLWLYMVDWWREAPPGPYRQTGDPRAALTDEQQLDALDDALEAVEFAGDRATPMWMDSLAASEGVPGPLDFVFLDADHSYEGVSADIAAWLPKLEPGGLLCGHDYTPRWGGVQKAVDEAAEAHGWTIELADNFTWFVRV